MKRRIKDFFSRDRKALYMILSIVLISIFSLTIVYAALSVTLNITGNAQVVASTWDIHLDNVQLNNKSVTGTAPTITGGTTATFSTTLTTPGDFYEFTIDVVNDGSIDAMIDSVTKTPTLTEAQAKYLNYIIEYQNGESINIKQLVSKNSFVRLKVRVEFRKDITALDLPTTSETLNLSFRVNYVQSDGSGSSVSNNGTKIELISVDGDINEIGTIVTINGTEKFYTIGTEGDNVKLLSMYNLYVGNECTSTDCKPIENPTGMQSSSAKGVIEDYPWIGTTAFTSEDAIVQNDNYYNGSIIEGYVDNYKNIIEDLGVDVVEARLITYDELTDTETIACSKSSCSDSPYEWIYSTSYWTGTIDTSQQPFGYEIYIINFAGAILIGSYDYDDLYGVRPVIIIPKSEILGTDANIKTIIQFTISGDTYQAEEGMTWEEWVNSEYNIDGFYVSYGFISSGSFGVGKIRDDGYPYYENPGDVILANENYVSKTDAN